MRSMWGGRGPKIDLQCFLNKKGDPTLIQLTGEIEIPGHIQAVRVAELCPMQDPPTFHSLPLFAWL
jgi:hypothetical protein